jgi:hypothetical protein
MKGRQGCTRASPQRDAVTLPRANGPEPGAYETVIFRGNCPLSSRNVFLFARSVAVGWTAPLVSVTRDTTVCSPAVGPFQSKVNSFQPWVADVSGAGAHASWPTSDAMESTS